MDLTVHRSLDGPSEPLWKLYRRAFDEMRVLAVQRHVLLRGEFDAVIADERVAKYVVRDPDRDRLAALATITNQLEAMPLISPEYFEHRWPELYREARIWYVGFLGVDPDYRGMGAMSQIIGRMCQEVGDSGGLISVDICEYRERVLRLPATLERIGGSYYAGMLRHRLDAQVYWGYEFPTRG